MKPIRALTIVAMAAALVVLGLPATATSAPPSNDNFADASVITALPFHTTLDLSEATTEPGEPVGYWGSNTVWYALTPSVNEIIRVDTSGTSMYPFTFVYLAGTGLGDLTQIAGTAPWGSPATTVGLQAGATYYIQAGNYYSWYSAPNLELDISVVPPPANDDFANAEVVAALPFSATLDMTAATVEPGEPTTACGTNVTQSAWYAFTPSASGSYGAYPGGASVNVFTGTSLGDLTSVACSQWYGLAFSASAGTTYYLQAYGGTVELRGLAPPTVEFGYSPGDPSIFDTVTFWNVNTDPTVDTTAWSFGDGSTATGTGPTHQYAKDGDYTVTDTHTTVDGRVGSATQVVRVRTHDVAIVKVVPPTSARAGQMGTIVVKLVNRRYPETIQLELFKSSQSDWQQIGWQRLTLPLTSGNKTRDVSFTYTFSSDDAKAGKVSFKAVVSLVDARDALSADNTLISAPTRITR